MAVTFNYDYYISVPSQEWYYMKVTGTDILTRCGDASAVQEIESGEDEFPVCNYLPETPGVPAGSWSITRTKVLPTLTSPQVFDPDDPTPEWCDLPGACGALPSEQELELCIEEIDPRPIYVQHEESSYTVDVGCNFEYIFIDTEIPAESACYTVVTDAFRTYTLELLEDPDPPDIALELALFFSNPKVLDNCEWTCQDDPNARGQDCREFGGGAVVLPSAQRYTPIGYLVDLISFSYVGSSATLPVCHNYNSPNWTLTW
jgi:hypothetical protein